MQFRVFKLRDNSFSRVYNYAIFYNHVKREIQALSSLQSSIKVRKIKTKKCWPWRTNGALGILLAAFISRSPPRGAAPEDMTFRLDKSYLSTMGCLDKNSTNGGTRGAIAT